MTKTGRFLDHGIRILAAAALLVAVMLSPILHTSASHKASPRNFIRRNFTIFKIGPSGKFAMSARPVLGEEAVSLHSDIEDELEADIEDEPTVTAPPTSLSHDVLPSPGLKPCSELDSLAVALAARPLRC
jgi:hypothetical protein